MTKKQMKQLATKLANLEVLIQTSNDENTVRDAKERMIHLNESSHLELDEMIALDEMISEMLKNKI